MTLSFILLAHWVGDFALQSSDMALGKSHSLKWLLIHVAVYTGVLVVFSLFLLPFDAALLFVGVNALLHALTDFFTSKWAAKYQDVPRKFFPIIGLDQLIHTLTLYWSLHYLS